MFSNENYYLPNKKRFVENPLLVKPEVGTTRRTTRDLPDDPEFRFGFKHEKSATNGVKDCVQKWETHTANAREQAPKDYLLMNRRALSTGAVTAAEVTKFHRANYIPKRVGAPAKKGRSALHSRGRETARHGIRSVRSEGVNDLIQGSYQESWFEQQKDYLQSVEKSKVKAKTVVTKTKASEGHRIGAKKIRSEAERDPLRVDYRNPLYDDVKSKVFEWAPTPSAASAGAVAASQAPVIEPEQAKEE